MTTSNQKKKAKAPKSSSRRPSTDPADDPGAFALAGAVRARRKALGLTQAELARFAGCGLAFLYALENDKRSVRLDKVLDVLSVLGLELVIDEGTAGVRAGTWLQDEQSAR